MNFKKSALMLSFAAAMSLLNTTVFAIDMSKSEVIKTTGKVAVKKTTSPEFKKLNSNLKLSGSLKNLDGGDKVRTYNDSTADLALKDTCILIVKEQSIFEVPQVLTQKDLKTLTAQQGSVLFKVAKGSNFQVQTADVICGVKGTTFNVTVENNFKTILETTGLQLGHLDNTQGHTLIEVFEGEVEAIPDGTNEKTSLKAGESLLVKRKSKGQEFLKNNVIKLKNNPNARITDLLGSKGAELLHPKVLSEFRGLNLPSEYNPQIQYDKNVTSEIYKYNKSVLYSKDASNVREAKDWDDIRKQFKGKKFHANDKFAKISRYETDKSFSSSSFGEVYLGNNTLAACKAANGESSLMTEPIDNNQNNNGIIMMGFGWAKIDTFNDSLGVTNELLVNFYKNGDQYITAIRNKDNNLYWEGTDDSAPQKVPTGDVAYVYNMSTNKGQWVNAAPGSIPDELANYNFSVINTMNQEKKQVEKQNKEQRKEAAKKAVNKLGGALKKGKKWF